MTVATPRRFRTLRAASVLLLLAALGAFSVNMVRIGFDPGLIKDLQQIPGSDGLPAGCVNGGIASYSGVVLALGGSPSVNRTCLTDVVNTAGGDVGWQPLAVLAALAILGAAAASAWGRRWYKGMTTGLCLVAAALLFVNSMRMAGVLEAHFGIPGGLVVSAPDPGFWWVGALLVVVALANLAAPVPELVRQALAPIEDPFEPEAAEARPAPDA
ncbi:MAG: hypothetical protein ABSA40_00325 [Candidatus Dormibacteria bacterium]